VKKTLQKKNNVIKSLSRNLESYKSQFNDAKNMVMLHKNEIVGLTRLPQQQQRPSDTHGDDDREIDDERERRSNAEKNEEEEEKDNRGVTGANEQQQRREKNVPYHKKKTSSVNATFADPRSSGRNLRIANNDAALSRSKRSNFLLRLEKEEEEKYRDATLEKKKDGMKMSNNENTHRAKTSSGITWKKRGRGGIRAAIKRRGIFGDDDDDAGSNATSEYYSRRLRRAKTPRVLHQQQHGDLQRLHGKKMEVKNLYNNSNNGDGRKNKRRIIRQRSGGGFNDVLRASIRSLNLTTPKRVDTSNACSSSEREGLQSMTDCGSSSSAQPRVRSALKMTAYSPQVSSPSSSFLNDISQSLSSLSTPATSTPLSPPPSAPLRLRRNADIARSIADMQRKMEQFSLSSPSSSPQKKSKRITALQRASSSPLALFHSSSRKDTASSSFALKERQQQAKNGDQSPFLSSSSSSATSSLLHQDGEDDTHNGKQKPRHKRSFTPCNSLSSLRHISPFPDDIDLFMQKKRIRLSRLRVQQIGIGDSGKNIDIEKSNGESNFFITDKKKNLMKEKKSALRKSILTSSRSAILGKGENDEDLFGDHKMPPAITLSVEEEKALSSLILLSPSKKKKTLRDKKTADYVAEKSMAIIKKKKKDGNDLSIQGRSSPLSAIERITNSAPKQRKQISGMKNGIGGKSKKTATSVRKKKISDAPAEGGVNQGHGGGSSSSFPFARTTESVKNRIKPMLLTTFPAVPLPVMGDAVRKVLLSSSSFSFDSLLNATNTAASTKKEPISKKKIPDKSAASEGGRRAKSALLPISSRRSFEKEVNKTNGLDSKKNNATVEDDDSRGGSVKISITSLDRDSATNTITSKLLSLKAIALPSTA